MSQRQYYTPATSFPTVDSQSPVFPLSTKFQEEGLQAQTDMWSPVKSNPELQMEQPLILATSKDKTCGSAEQEQEDGGLLPLDMQLLYMFGKAAAAAPASDLDANDASSLDLDVLKAVEKVSISLGSLRPVCSLYSQFLILQSPSPELLNLDGLLQPVLSAEILALQYTKLVPTYLPGGNFHTYGWHQNPSTKCNELVGCQCVFVKHNLLLHCPTLLIALGNALLAGVFPGTKISQIFLSEKIFIKTLTMVTMA